MKKILFAAVAALTICVSAYTYCQQSKSVALNNLALANVEALAEGEEASPCGGPKSDFGICRSQNTVNCKDLSGCQ